MFIIKVFTEIYRIYGSYCKIYLIQREIQQNIQSPRLSYNHVLRKKEREDRPG